MSFGLVMCVLKVNLIDCILGVYDGLCGFDSVAVVCSGFGASELFIVHFL